MEKIIYYLQKFTFLTLAIILSGTITYDALWYITLEKDFTKWIWEYRAIQVIICIIVTIGCALEYPKNENEN